MGLVAKFSARHVASKALRNMAEAASLDKLYKASTTLVGVNAKLVKEGVDEFAEVRVCAHDVFFRS